MMTITYRNEMIGCPTCGPWPGFCEMVARPGGVQLCRRCLRPIERRTVTGTLLGSKAWHFGTTRADLPKQDDVYAVLRELLEAGEVVNPQQYRIYPERYAAATERARAILHAVLREPAT